MTPRTTANPGPLALVGAGEFLPTMEPVDRHLLALADGPSPSRVVVLPTASAPEGHAVFWRWGTMGLDHFRRLGVQAEVLSVTDRASAHDDACVQAIRNASFVYFSGGQPRYLLETLKDTPVWSAVLDAWRRGAALAGCSAGAMVFGAAIRSFRAPDAPLIPALGLLHRVVVLPHFDRWGLARRQPLRDALPPEVLLIGVDEHTALVWSEGRWQVMGQGCVTLWRSDGLERYPVGSTVPLDPPRTP
jgi:cyanophycinase